MNKFILLCTGTLFGFGLAMSGMTDTAKVIGFLDIFGQWVPDLAFVMGGAVAVTLVAFRFIMKRKSPVLCSDFDLPTSTSIDKKLLGGAALFGIGWGIYGYCPGPALAALVYLQTETVVFVVSMMVGMALVSLLQKKP